MNDFNNAITYYIMQMPDDHQLEEDFDSFKQSNTKKKQKCDKIRNKQYLAPSVHNLDDLINIANKKRS